MTIREALDIINVNGYGYPEDESLEAHRIINHEMAFRMKKRPSQKIQGTSLFPEAKCPQCGSVVYRTECACSLCGQVLDWWEVEE